VSLWLILTSWRLVYPDDMAKTLSLLVTLLLFSLAPAQTPPAERKDGDLKFEPFTISFEGQNVVAELGRLVVRENEVTPKLI